MPHMRQSGAGIVFLRFLAAKNSKNTIPARNWRDPMPHPATERGGNRVFEVFGS